jgi:glutamyl-tRNA reductase
MNLVACGINYKKTPVAIREQFIFSQANLAVSLRNMLEETNAQEAIILSTCNRTEFYCINDETRNTLDWVHNKCLPKNILQDYGYIYKREHALCHMLRVASGLDSMILGEPQIVGQFKKAFAVASALGVAGEQFKRLFQYIFRVTKQVRQQTGITAHPVSLAFAVVASAKQIFAHLSNSRVLLIGAGEVITLIAKHLLAEGVQHFWIANRTLNNAKKLASIIGAKSLSLAEIPQHLPHIDVIIAAASSPFPLIKKISLETAFKKRRRRLLFIADLGIPRNVATEVNQLEDVYLYTLADLQTLIEKNLCQRKTAALRAEALIEYKVQEYLASLRIQEEAVPLIKAYREKAESWRDEELKKAFASLKKGLSQESIMQCLAHRLTNKLLHVPSVALRKAAQLNQKDVLRSASQLLVSEQN